MALSLPLLDGVRVVSLAGRPAAMAARILSDLGAAVTRARTVDEVWDAGSLLAAGEAALLDALRAAHVVIDTPYEPGATRLDPSVAPDAVWVSVTPFGLDGPRARWLAGDLGVMAASGNLFATGDPDRPPVRCAMPVAFAHTGPETVIAALTALWCGHRGRVDVSMQETVLVANMATPARFPVTGFRGQRRGANIGRTREIWPTKDGWVSFGLRGGKARVASLELIASLAALPERDWSTFNHTAADDDDLRAIEEAVAEYFATKTMTELYELACETNLMLAPVNSPAEIVANQQLATREFFDASTRGVKNWVRLTEPPPAGFGESDADTSRQIPPRNRSEDGTPAWAGVKILELGSGAAGPIATRYFAEHGATVVRIESRSRPDFLRVYALGPQNPHGLEGSTMFDGLNCGKQSVALNLKHPDAVAIATRLIDWADAVAENFAPRAMKGFGLDYDTLAVDRPDLVMLSACLNGQTGPHRDYPGFGGQGAALSGYNFLTGWPDRAPVGPHGTITDSLAPRFGAALLAAALFRRRATGRGVHIDLSQVEAAVFSLAPWLREYTEHGRVIERMGNRSPGAVPHGVFACAGTERWVAIAVRSDDEWSRLAHLAGIDDAALATVAARQARVDDIEAAIGAWTVTRDRDEVAAELQAAGVEAVPVADFGDLHADPQLAGRSHFQPLDHAVLGAGLYERNGFRLLGRPSGYASPGPLLGEHTDIVLTGVLGLTAGEIADLRSSGAVE